MDQERFGKLIKNIRKKYNLTQKDIACKYHVTYQAVSKWENGKNMPDISLIKEICNDYKIDMNNMFSGNIKKRSNLKKIVISIGIILLFIILLIVIVKSSDNVQFKNLSTSCENFNITGIISYNKDKSAINISNVDYCGGDDTLLYEDITCTLYESSNGIDYEIFTTSGFNTTLENFLKNVYFKIDNYEQICKKYDSNTLFLKIKAIKDNKEISYKIPLEMNEDC